MMSSSLGPAGESMPVTPDSCSFASATYALPGPTMRRTGAIVCVPYAIAAIAPAPPIAYTSLTPASSPAASTTCDGSPFAPGGEQSTMRFTPATRAGTTPMSTELGYAARPPGAYTPTESSGSGRRPTMTPGSTSSSVVRGRKARCTASMFAAARSSAARTGASSVASACARASRGTASACRATPSSSAASEISASSPSALTRPTIAAVRSRTESSDEVDRSESSARCAAESSARLPRQRKSLLTA